MISTGEALLQQLRASDAVIQDNIEGISFILDELRRIEEEFDKRFGTNEPLCWAVFGTCCCCLLYSISITCFSPFLYSNAQLQRPKPSTTTCSLM